MGVWSCFRMFQFRAMRKAIWSDGAAWTAYTFMYSSEVEFGRLSVARSPNKVLDHSLAEALNKLIAADASSTDNIAIVLDASGRLAIATTTTVPVDRSDDHGCQGNRLAARESGAVQGNRQPDRNGQDDYGCCTSLQGWRTTPATTLTWTVPTTINIDLLKASLLAAAGDKTGTITLDTVMYINPIVGVTDDLSTFTYDRYTTYKDLR